MHPAKLLSLTVLASLAIAASQTQAAFPTIALKPISVGELYGPTNISVANDGSGRLFVCDQFGQIRIIQNGMLLPTPFLDIASKVVPLTASYDERGLLGLAFHPNYSNPLLPGYRKFYVYYNSISPNARGNPPAIAASFPVSAVAVGNPCVVTTAAAHGLVPGNSVTIASVAGGTFTPAINGTFLATIVDATHFSVPVDCTSNTGVTGGTVSYAISAIAVGNPCTVTTAIPHGLATGNWVTISGVTGGVFSPTINALNSITVVDATHFTVPVNCTDNTGVTRGTIARAVPAPVNCRDTISEFQVTGNANVADPTSERVLLTFDKPQFNHDGGQLEFGPDGFLYFSSGDGGGANDTSLGHAGASSPGTLGNLGNGQDKTSLMGKLHRIDPLGTNAPGGQYGIPPTNPFAGAGGGVREEIYAYGLRNTWRFSFDVGPGGTGRLFAADVGQNNVEEVDIIVRGGNYGWHAKEGMFTFDTALLTALTTGGSVRVDVGTIALPGGATLIDPIAQYAHPTVTIGTPALPKLGISIAGGYVYRGSAIPALQGKYVFGDYSATGGASSGAPNGIFLGIEETTPGNWTPTPTVLNVFGGNPIPARLYSFGRDESGELYVTAKTTVGPVQLDPMGKPAGIIYKIVPLQTVTTNLVAVKDNTIFSEDAASGNFTSDGLGHLYAGRTGGNYGPYVRRALIAFDLTGQVPAGAVIQSAQVILNLSKPGPGSSGTSLSLYRLTETWGEGTSLNTMGGYGSGATTNDATWAQRFYNTQAWTTAGGSFAGTASASATVGGAGLISWGSNAALLADVVAWVNTPASNAGWIIRGDEVNVRTACQFDSKDTFGGAPTLRISYAGAPSLTRWETWRNTYFDVGHFVNDLADLEGDGIVNLLEYAWGFSPKAVNPGNQANPGIAVATAVDGLGQTLFTVDFRRDPRATELTYVLQTTSDFVTWTPIAMSSNGDDATGTGVLFEDELAAEAPIRIVHTLETLPAGTKRFARLVVSRGAGGGGNFAASAIVP